MMRPPKLGDVRLSKSFSPGDRLLARVGFDPSVDQCRKIQRAVDKMIGEPARLLILNIKRMKLIRKRGKEIESLTGGCGSDVSFQGIVNLQCSVVDLKANDKLVVFVSSDDYRDRRKGITQCLRNWAGNDVDIRVEVGMFWREQTILRPS